jgi:hypothetical protein
LWLGACFLLLAFGVIVSWIWRSHPLGALSHCCLELFTQVCFLAAAQRLIFNTLRASKIILRHLFEEFLLPFPKRRNTGHKDY